MKQMIRHLSLCLALIFCLSAAAVSLPLSAAAESAAPAKDITSRCAIQASEGKVRHLTDDNIRSSWSYSGSSAWLTVELPDDAVPGGLMLQWDFDPSGYEIEELGADGSQLRLRDQSCTFPNIVSYFDLLPETRIISMRMTAAGQKICGLAVYTEGELPQSLQVWQAPVEKADLMVVSTHQDDELIFFGGVIPYCDVALGHPTEVVYMANCGRFRRQEALKGLWVMGVRTYPDFINMKDKRVKTIDEGLQLWNGQEHVLEELVTRIRRYRPEVILTHDLNGEYGHNQHRITARSMQAAIEAAADPSRFPDSYAAYGAWQVKKLYLHLYAENEMVMDWKTPLQALNGKSPLEVARIGYDMHKSQHKYYQVKDGGKYDNARFGLYYTTVGPDTPGLNDFFEHVDCVNDLQPLPTLLKSPVA